MIRPESDVTLLVTHYNRPRALERQLSTFQKLGMTFANIIVSDDASRPENLNELAEIQKQYPFELVTTPMNRGLGNNINKGQDRVKTKYTLYAQEDFYPTDQFPEKFAIGLKAMEERPDVDILRFYIKAKPPEVKAYKYGFSEMIFRIWRPGAYKFFCYSDWPHLRRAKFFERFGRYREGVPVIKCEKAMVMSFLQDRGVGLLCDVSNSFVHGNENDEPSTQDYSTFFKIKGRLPDWLFDLIWTAKLTLEYFFVRFRS